MDYFAIFMSTAFIRLFLFSNIFQRLLFFPIEPAEELVQVNNLEYGSLVPTANDTFRTTVSWQKPEFAHSDVKYYKYKLLPTDVSQRERRGTPLNTEITTVRIMNSIHYQINIIFFLLLDWELNRLVEPERYFMIMNHETHLLTYL